VPVVCLDQMSLCAASHLADQPAGVGGH
jgi:hypothetical protein